MIAATLIAVAVFALGIFLVIGAWRRHHTPPELRGDWWSRFETEFRAYADAPAARRRRRATRDRRPPPR